MEDIKCIAKHLHSPQVLDVYERAYAHCNDAIRTSSRYIDEYLAEHPLEGCRVCYVAIGSLGRREALAASDLDLLPVFESGVSADQTLEHGKGMRRELATKLGMSVSQGEDLTKATGLDRLVDQETIGGENDSSSALTQRILVLTESAQLCGGLDLNTIRREILEAYAKQPRGCPRRS